MASIPRRHMARVRAFPSRPNAPAFVRAESGRRSAITGWNLSARSSSSRARKSRRTVWPTPQALCKRRIGRLDPPLRGMLGGVQPSDEACSGRPARHHFHRTLGVAFRRQWSGLGESATEHRPGGTRTHSPAHPAGPGRRPGARRQLSPEPTLAERILAALPLVKLGSLGSPQRCAPSERAAIVPLS
jgi:hypothetical protein